MKFATFTFTIFDFYHTVLLSFRKGLRIHAVLDRKIKTIDVLFILFF